MTPQTGKFDEARWNAGWAEGEAAYLAGAKPGCPIDPSAKSEFDTKDEYVAGFLLGYGEYEMWDLGCDAFLAGHEAGDSNSHAPCPHSNERLVEQWQAGWIAGVCAQANGYLTAH